MVPSWKRAVSERFELAGLCTLQSCGRGEEELRGIMLVGSIDMIRFPVGARLVLSYVFDSISELSGLGFRSPLSSV